MLFFSEFKHRIPLFLSLVIIVPLGIYTKFYSGIGEQWVRDYAGDILSSCTKLITQVRVGKRHSCTHARGKIQCVINSV
jgi:hypothetical protein